MFLEAYQLRMGRYSNMTRSSRAATENFVFLKAANNGSLKTNCCFESRARWNALAKNWPASRQENSFFKVWPVGLIFLHFHQWRLHLFLRRKNQNYRTRNACQSQDGGFLEEFFAVCPETWVALDKANFSLCNPVLFHTITIP